LKESKPDDEIENVRVVVRVRPLETSAGKNIVVTDKTSRTVTVQKPNAANEPPKVYQFDNVFGEDSKQVSET
jgi:kinesin family member 3A